MFGKTWVFGSLFAAITLITTAAVPARAEDRRWGLGQPHWQPPAHAGWADNRGQDRRDWRSESRERHPWWRRDHDHRWDNRRDDRGSDRQWERRRAHEWWRRHHRWRD